VPRSHQKMAWQLQLGWPVLCILRLPVAGPSCCKVTTSVALGSRAGTQNTGKLVDSRSAKWNEIHKCTNQRSKKNVCMINFLGLSWNPTLVVNLAVIEFFSTNFLNSILLKYYVLLLWWAKEIIRTYLWNCRKFSATTILKVTWQLGAIITSWESLTKCQIIVTLCRK
jgi:hypothetical protein